MANEFDEAEADQTLVSHTFPGGTVPKVDPAYERIAYLSTKNGYLIGRNSVLEISNSHLMQRNKELAAVNARYVENELQLHKRLETYEDTNYDLRHEIERLKQYEPKDEPDEIVEVKE